MGRGWVEGVGRKRDSVLCAGQVVPAVRLAYPTHPTPAPPNRPQTPLLRNAVSSLLAYTSHTPSLPLPLTKNCVKPPGTRLLYPLPAPPQNRIVWSPWPLSQRTTWCWPRQPAPRCALRLLRLLRALPVRTTCSARRRPRWLHSSQRRRARAAAAWTRHTQVGSAAGGGCWVCVRRGGVGGEWVGAGPSLPCLGHTRS